MALVVKEEDCGPPVWASPDLTDLICQGKRAVCQDILQLQAAIRMHQFWAQVMGLRCHPICGDTRQLDTLNPAIYSPMEGTVFGVCVQAGDSGTFYLQEKLKFYYLLCL